MSTLELAPDVETMLWSFLRAQPEVTALVDAARIYSVLPTKFDAGPPFVRVERVGGVPLIRDPIVDQPRVQISAYRGTKTQTLELAETIRAVLAARFVGAHELGVVSRVEWGALAWLPDTSMQTDGGGPRPRYLFDVRPVVKPLPNPAA